MIKTPLLTVDIIIKYQDGIVLIRRKNEPYKGHYALPGGFVDVGETVETAAIREAKEETGLDITITKLVGVYSDRERDPRGHAVSLCYLATGHGKLCAGSDAEDAKVFRTSELPETAFDHDQMIDDAFHIMNDNTSELTAGDIHNGKHLWYIVVENTNSRVVNKEEVPIIFTSRDAAGDMTEQIAQGMESPYVVISVAEYNQTFRRFMELDH